MAKYYITTSIPYANGDPHIGFALELLYADVLARLATLRGDEVIFSTGTDEHGLKIVEMANKLDMSVDDYVKSVSAKFKSLTDVLNISNNRFIRTTDKGHIERVQEIWKRLNKDIYKSVYSGWYCVGDEAFFTETEVKANNGVCPAHNRPYDKIEEENYFFRLSKYADQIKQSIVSDQFQLYPATRKNEILSVFDQGLDDISISRSKDKLQWGINIPGDKTQVMYVWFEALLNYITVIGYPEHEDFDFWPADVQIIGKDIIRFHAAIWPAILLALNLSLPKQLYIHGFVTHDGKKMSKSLGNVVNPFEVVDLYGVDAFRYYILRHMPSYADGDFSFSKFTEVYNSELANELGNLVQRVRVMLQKYVKNSALVMLPPEHDISAYVDSLKVFHFDRALDAIWDQVRGLNQYIDEEKPWQVAKSGDQEHIKEIMSYLLASINEIADLLQPFMPQTSFKIKDLMNLDNLSVAAVPLFPKKDVS